jgi:carbamate kinase
VRWLLDQGCVVICAGGGGIPTMYQPGTRTLMGVEAVIDKDWATAVLAEGLSADLLVIATDVDAVYLDWGTPQQAAVAAASPEALHAYGFAAGSMGPKVAAAASFATASGNPAFIGALGDLTAMLAGTAGTRVDVSVDGLQRRAG